MFTRACVAVLLVLFLAGCGEDTTVSVINQAPTIEFTFTPIAVTAQTQVDLTVTVSDPNEDDRLTVTWEISRGALVPLNAERTAMQWSVPEALGTDSVTVTVSDGEASVSITEVLRVGTQIVTVPGAWLLSESPYILKADDSSGTPQLLISDKRTIPAGIEIFVDLPETVIDVTGTLTVEGDPDNPVIIRPNDRELFCGDKRGWWEGIFVNSNGNVSLNHAQIWYAVNGVRLRDMASATIRDSFLKCSGDNSVLHEGFGSLVVDSCEVTDSAGNGIRVTNTGRPASISVTATDISFNESTGLILNFNDEFNQTPTTVEGNQFEFNDTHGIILENWVWPVINYNHFDGNGDRGASNIRLQGPIHSGATDTLDVTCNYWGQVVTSQSTIDNTIRDSLDNSSLGARLRTLPWLNADPFMAASPPPCDGGL